MKNRILILTTACTLFTTVVPAPAQDSAGGNVVKVSTTLHNDGTRTVTKLDPEARTTEASKYAGDTLLQRSVFKLNDQNKPDSGEIYDPKGRLLMKVKNVHDDQGRVAEETRYTAKDEFMVRLVYRYGLDGRVNKIEGYDAAGNLLPTGPGKRDVKKDKKKR
jgi:hypothetical protein